MGKHRHRDSGNQQATMEYPTISASEPPHFFASVISVEVLIGGLCFLQRVFRIPRGVDFVDVSGPHP